MNLNEKEMEAIREVAREYATESREVIRQAFGDVELKTDCKNYVPGQGCRTLTEYTTGCRTYQQCERNVCYFYERKDREVWE